MAFPFLISLARFAPRMQRQEGDVLLFDRDGIALLKKSTELARYPYPELQRLRYHHFPGNFSRSLQWMSGNLFQRREASLRLETQSGEVREFWLESDLEYRTRELAELFGELYEMGVPLEEYAFGGRRLRMLEGV